MFVIGTAGHIDHGKSAIITRLTGIDPDRLPEEKERGMTIDIGFAHYDTPDGQRIGIIDVPGHERFVRNMIAGAGGIDAVILVVAADDGWMPQSQEHYQIVQLLGIGYGLVVLTKIDLVKDDWVDLVEDDVRTKLKGGFLDNCPIVRVSSVTGDGFDELKNEIDQLARQVAARADIGKPRLYIDRSFVLSGMGGVVAGTLRGGTLSAGQDVAIFPAQKTGRIRTIQSHGENIGQGRPGQRTSISLTGIDKEYLTRGSVVGTSEIINDYPAKPVLAVEIKLIPESKISVENRRRILMILGTTEVEGEIRTFSSGPVTPGGSGIVFIKPFGPVLGLIGDKFVLRLPTPQVTIGGGTILDLLENIPRKKERERYKYLDERKDLTPRNFIETELEKRIFVKPESDLKWCDYSIKELTEILNSLMEEGTIEKFDDKYLQKSRLDEVLSACIMNLENAFKKQPHLDGLSPEKIGAGTKVFGPEMDFVFQYMIGHGLLIKKGNKYDLPNRQLTVRGEVKAAAEGIVRRLEEGGFSPPTISELVENDRIKKEALNYLLSSKQVVKASNAIVFHVQKWNKILAIIRDMLSKDEELTVASLRGKLGNSRKYSLPILEETDRRQVTVRQGDRRVKGVKFEAE